MAALKYRRRRQEKMKKSASEMAKVALTRWQKEVNRGGVSGLGGISAHPNMTRDMAHALYMQYAMDAPRGVYKNITSLNPSEESLDLLSSNEGKQTRLNTFRNRLRDRPVDPLIRNQEIRRQRLNELKSKKMPTAIPTRISALKDSIHPSLYDYITADSTLPFLKEEIPRIIEDGRAKMRAAREAERGTQATQHVVEESIPSSAARAGAKSKLPRLSIRNLGIGAGALGLAGLGGYGLYRALRKEEPEKQASMKKSADEMAKKCLYRLSKQAFWGRKEVKVWEPEEQYEEIRKSSTPEELLDSDLYNALYMSNQGLGTGLLHRKGFKYPEQGADLLVSDYKNRIAGLKPDQKQFLSSVLWGAPISTGKQASMKKSAAEMAEEIVKKTCTPKEKEQCCGKDTEEKKEDKGNPFVKKEAASPEEIQRQNAINLMLFTHLNTPNAFKGKRDAASFVDSQTPEEQQALIRESLKGQRFAPKQAGCSSTSSAPKKKAAPKDIAAKIVSSQKK